MAPFFLAWTIYGTTMFININRGDANCSTDNNDTFAFLIFWFILSYVLIFCYLCLVMYGFSSAQRSAQVKKSMLQLLRKLNGSEMGEMNQEIYENALYNIQDDIMRHQSTVRTLREYGIYLLQQGIDPTMFARMRVITYKHDMIDLGVVRCSICFADFKEGDRVKEYP